MDWRIVAEQVVAVLAPVAPVLALAANEAVKALGKKFGETGAGAALEKGKALWNKIKARFAQDDEMSRTMALFADNPAAFETALASVLAARLKDDPGFASELQTLLAEAVADEATATFLTRVYGQARVGKIINVGKIDARDVHF
jgi:hypothetical protein